MAFIYRENLVSFPLFSLMLVLLFVVLSSDRHMSMAETNKGGGAVDKEKLMSVRFGIGSRPPRCDGKCVTCSHCEAVQVPTNPQAKVDKRGVFLPSRFDHYWGQRGEEGGRDGGSNYMPVSWKCKCGKLIFDP